MHSKPLKRDWSKLLGLQTDYKRKPERFRSPKPCPLILHWYARYLFIESRLARSQRYIWFLFWNVVLPEVTNIIGGNAAASAASLKKTRIQKPRLLFNITCRCREVRTSLHRNHVHTLLVHIVFQIAMAVVGLVEETIPLQQQCGHSHVISPFAKVCYYFEPCTVDNLILKTCQWSN